MPELEYSKTYVRSDNTAVLICPYCSQWKKISVDRFRGNKHELKIKCYCKQSFKGFLEFRKKVRKKKFLRGTYLNLSHKDSSGFFTIEDISATGLAFITPVGNKLNVGDELSVEFIIDDEQKTAISCNAVVKNVGQRRIGCEFEVSDEGIHGLLEFYLKS